MKQFIILVLILTTYIVKGQEQFELLSKKDFMDTIERVNNILYDSTLKKTVRIYYNHLETIIDKNLDLKRVDNDYWVILENGQKVHIGLNEEPRFFSNNRLYTLKTDYKDEYWGISTVNVYDLSLNNIKLLHSKSIEYAPLDFYVIPYNGNIIIKQPVDSGFTINLYDQSFLLLKLFKFKSGIKYVSFNAYKQAFVVSINPIYNEAKTKILVINAVDGSVELDSDLFENDRVVKNVFLSDKYICAYSDGRLRVLKRSGELLFSKDIWLPYIDATGLNIDDNDNSVLLLTRQNIILFNALNGVKRFEKKISQFYNRLSNGCSNIEPTSLGKTNSEYVLTITCINSLDKSKYNVKYENGSIVTLDKAGNMKRYLKINTFSSLPIIQNSKYGFGLITDKSVYNIKNNKH